MNEMDIPESWTELELGLALGNTIGGANITTEEYSDSGVRVVLKTDIQPMGLVTASDRYVSQEVVSKKYTNRLTYQGNLLICMRDLSQKANILGLISIVDNANEGSLVSQGITIANKVSDKIVKKFLSLYSNAPSYRSYIQSKKRGSTQVHLGNDDIMNLKIPLPPYKEQERIVEKINFTFEKINAVENNLSKVEFLLDGYRESLLTKTYRGEIVPQEATDEPASFVLDRIREKRSLIEVVKKNGKNYSAVAENDKPYDIPKSWEWVKLGEISDQIQYGLTASASSKGSHKFLRITDITSKGVAWDNVPYCSPSKEEASKLELLTGDILFARTGGTVGKSFLIRDVVKNSVFASYLIKVRPTDTLVLPEFLSTFFNSPSYWDFVTGNQRGAAQPNVNGTTLSNLPVPLPPLAEQIRIVQRYNSLIKDIDKLKDNLKVNQKIMKNLKESILKKAYEGELVGQIPSEGSGQELLKSITEERHMQVENKIKDKEKKPIKKSIRISISNKNKVVELMDIIKYFESNPVGDISPELLNAVGYSADHDAVEKFYIEIRELLESKKLILKDIKVNGFKTGSSYRYTSK